MIGIRENEKAILRFLGQLRDLLVFICFNMEDGVGGTSGLRTCGKLILLINFSSSRDLFN